MALFRAVETARGESDRLFEDSLASGFLPPILKLVARLATLPGVGRAVTWALDAGWPRTRSSGVVRTRFIDDAVTQGLHTGAGQLLLLGAGFDSRAYRLAAADSVSIFEVDHPATQAAKRRRLARMPSAGAGRVRFVAVDFERTDLEAALRHAGFDTTVPAVVVWEGVVSYLSAPAVDHNFSLLQRLTAAGSRLIFTYVDKGALDGSVEFVEAARWKHWVRFSGEPFTFGFDPAALAAYLAPYGFTLSSDDSTADLAARVRMQGRCELGSTLYHVAVAERR